MKSPKISPTQLLFLMLLARLMHTMIYRFDGFTSGTPIMLGLIAATAIEAVIAFPSVIYYQSGGSSAFSELGSLKKPLGYACSAYFAIIAGGTVALFAEFLTTEFPDSVPPYVAIILLFAAACFCAIPGIEGMARAGSVVFWLFAAFFAIMIAVSEGEFNWLNLRPMRAGDLPELRDYVLGAVSSSWQIPMLVILGEHLQKGWGKSFYGFLASKTAIIGALLMLITLVLWRYVGVLGYPIYALGAYAKSNFIQRFDAINMLIWALNCAIVTAVYIFICSKPTEKRTSGALFFAALAAVVAVYEYRRGLRYNETWFLIFKLSGVLIFGFLLPLTALIIKSVKKHIGRENAC